MKSNLRSVIMVYVVQISAVLLIAALTGLLVYAASGRLLPFLESEQPDFSDSAYVPPVSGDESDDDVSSDDDDTSSDIPPSRTDITDGFENFGASLPEGYSLSCDPYGDGNVLALLDASPLGLDGVQSVEVRMGFIRVTGADGSVRIFDSALNDVTEILSPAEQLSARDSDGRPLFYADGSYYVFSDGALVQSDYSEADDGRGFDFDYPAYLGVQSERVYRIRYGNAYGYRSSGGNTIVMCAFREAFAWGECDVGCVISAPYGEEKLNFYNFRSQEISTQFYAPLTRGEESIGYFYFDDGLTRVRIRGERGEDGEYAYAEGMMLSDGSLMKLPADYTVRAYSDSVILLEKGGKYGYMSSRGRWITDPSFTAAHPFYEGLAVAADADGKYGMIDTSGNIVLPFVFDYVSNCSDGVIIALSEEYGDILFVKAAPVSE